MRDQFIFMTHRTDCYHCKQMADQIIKAMPNKAEVACDNCGATRVFIPRIEDVSNLGEYTKVECYDVWNLVSVTECRNCHTTGPHDIVIGCRHFTIRCRNCKFTHFYKFDLEYIAKDELKI
ncbi:MAG: hypothetical protein ABR887_04025 [Methanoregulaceae archaeon]